MKQDVHCVIMAGGVGSRFWPMSRQSMPKQYLDILGTGSSLIQLTHNRFLSICDERNFMVVTSAEYTELTQQHLPSLKPGQILAEPARRNTAPCIAYAAYKLRKTNPDAVMVITPSDHIILKMDAFTEAIEQGIKHAAETNHLVTLGIQPTRPDSGYGYIQFHHQSDYAAKSVKRVKTFTEKPSVDLALQFLQSGDFYWNSGMFIWKVSAIIEAFETHLPVMAEFFEQCNADYWEESESKAISKVYSVCDSISIDYGIMEKANNVDVILGQDFGWSDLGTWGSLYEQIKQGESSNVALGGNIKTYDSKGSMIMIPKNKLAIIQGLNNYIVIDTEDVLLICQKDEEQKIKQFVQDVKLSKGAKFL